jgi:hypothetical protein
MLQEGQDFIALKTLYKTEPIQLSYKVNDHVSVTFVLSGTNSIDNLSITWVDLLEQYPDLHHVYQYMAEWNSDVPCELWKTLCVETHIRNPKVAEIVYINDCIPSFNR